MDNSTSYSKPVRDSLYYLDSVTFLVEGVLFKIPRSYFEKNSEFFRSLFSLPLGNNNAEGLSDESPIRLRFILSTDFRRLLKVMYPEYTSHTMDTEEWKSVLKLSTLWEFEDLREKAIAELSKAKMDAVEKVMLARSYGVGDMLLDGYMTLVEQKTTLSTEEARILGYETAFKLCRMREETYQKVDKVGGHYTSGRRSFNSLKMKIYDNFRTELEDAGYSKEELARDQIKDLVWAFQ